MRKRVMKPDSLAQAGSATLMAPQQPWRVPMIFGKSLFELVLDRVEEDLPAEAPEDVTMRIRGLTTGFVVDQMEGISVATARIDDPYRDLQPEDLFFGQPQAFGDLEVVPAMTEAITPPPLHLLRTEPSEIAEDLGLLASDTIATLHDRRRVFALANHPDRVPAAHRPLANKRMTTANNLIDQAISRVSALEKLGLR